MRLIFDLDNTLFDRDTAFIRCLSKLLLHFDITPSEQQLAKVIETDNSGKLPRRAFCQQLMAIFPQLPQRFEQLWPHFERLPEEISPNTHINQMLAGLRQNHTLILLSNGTSEMQRRKLNRAGLSAYFDDIYISGEVGMEKPDVEIFRLAMGNDRTDDCVMIGDDLDRDIAPALAMNMTAVWVSSSLVETAQFSHQISHILHLDKCTWI